MKIIVANVDSNAKSNKDIDLQMKKKLSVLKFTSRNVGKYELVSNDYESRIVEKTKNTIDSHIKHYSTRNYIASNKIPYQKCKYLLSYYRGIQYIVIIIDKEKIKVNLLFDTGVDLKMIPFINLRASKIGDELLVGFPYSYKRYNYHSIINLIENRSQ